MSDDAADALRARLDASRAALLAALEGITERAFAADLGDGTTVVRALAELAAAERSDVAAAGGPGAATRVAEKPLPPQVVHDLAGARYQTLRLVESAGGAVETRAIVERVAAREEAVAARIAALKAGEA